MEAKTQTKSEDSLLLKASESPGILNGWQGPVIVEGVEAVLIRKADLENGDADGE